LYALYLPQPLLSAFEHVLFPPDGLRVRFGVLRIVVVVVVGRGLGLVFTGFPGIFLDVQWPHISAQFLATHPAPQYLLLYALYLPQPLLSAFEHVLFPPDGLRARFGVLRVVVVVVVVVVVGLVFIGFPAVGQVPQLFGQ